MTERVDRRLFRRVKADVLARPTGALAHSRTHRRVTDISLGGLRVYSEEEHHLGERMEMEVLFGGGESATFIAEVAWVDALPSSAPARFDVGLRYLEIEAEDLERLSKVLEGSS
jgi:hypothetical protein